MSDRCQRPDRDVPGIVCGYPLPCPWHTVTIDTVADPPTITIPVVQTPPITCEALDRLKRVARALEE